MSVSIKICTVEVAMETSYSRSRLWRLLDGDRGYAREKNGQFFPPPLTTCFPDHLFN